MMDSASQTAVGPSGSAAPLTSGWQRFAHGVNQFNIITGYLSALVIILTSFVVCYGVFMRYFMKTPLDWSLELSIFMLIAATFMSAGYTQLVRGHVTIEVLDHLLTPNGNRWRYLMGDILSLIFCAFVAWNAWEFCYEAFEDGRVTESTWEPKLWIPYSFMAIGMTALSLQLVVQIADFFISRKHLSSTGA